MTYRLNIRYRIFLTYPLLGFLISVIVIVFFMVSFDLLERQFMDSFLLEELDHFIESNQHNPGVSEQRSRYWHIYKVDADHQDASLDFLSSYEPGTYDLMFQGVMQDVGVAVRKGARYYIFYKDEALESMELSLISFMVAGAFLVVWAATAYGLWFSKRVLKPVMTLVDEVRALDVAAAKAIGVNDYAEDEVGFLASEFDSYVNKIRQMIEREREFTANASHELRTPLTIIKTATEALLLKQNMPDDVRARLLRIERASDEMSNRLQVFLILAREPENVDLTEAKLDLVKCLEQLLEDYESLRPLTVRLIKKIHASPCIQATEAMLSIVLGNVIKNAFTNTGEGTITIEVSERQLTITDSGKGIAEDCLQHVRERGYKDDSSQGQGLGLSLVQRICDYYQWRLNIDSVSGLGTTVTLVYGDSDD